MSLYREFALRSPAVWPALVAFVKANAQAEAANTLGVVFE